MAKEGWTHRAEAGEAQIPAMFGGDLPRAGAGVVVVQAGARSAITGRMTRKCGTRGRGCAS